MHIGWSIIRIIAQNEVEERVAWAARQNSNALNHPRKGWIDTLSDALRRKETDPELENASECASYVCEPSASQGA